MKPWLALLSAGASLLACSSSTDGGNSDISTLTALVSSATPSLVGDTVTLTATVSGQSGTPTGSVTFQESGADISGCAGIALVAGSAACEFTSLTAGSHPMQALFSGSGRFLPSNSPTVIQVVNLATPAIGLTSDANPSVNGQPVTLTATVTGRGLSPTGSVTFQDNGTPIATCLAQPLTAGAATCVLTALPVATHPVTAAYSGDAAYAGATSTAVNQIVNPAATTTAVGSSSAASSAGQAVTFTATVAPVAPGAGTVTGSVAFRDNGVDIGSCTAQAITGGNATCVIATLPAGTHSITASYAGSTGFGASTSAAFNQVVSRAASTLALSQNPNPTVFGENSTFTATISGALTPSGSVTFRDNGAAIGGCVARTVSAAVATCVLGFLSVGVHPITAEYGGDGNNLPSTSSAVIQLVNKGSTTTSVTILVAQATPGGPITFAANPLAVPPAGGFPTGTVTFRADGVSLTGCQAVTVVPSQGATCTVAPPAISTGPHTITAIYSGDSSFNASTSQGLAVTIN